MITQAINAYIAGTVPRAVPVPYLGAMAAWLRGFAWEGVHAPAPGSLPAVLDVSGVPMGPWEDVDPEAVTPRMSAGGDQGQDCGIDGIDLPPGTLRSEPKWSQLEFDPEGNSKLPEVRAITYPEIPPPPSLPRIGYPNPGPNWWAVLSLVLTMALAWSVLGGQQ